MATPFPVMTDDQLKQCINSGFSQCVVEAMTDGTICWDINESREREPIHIVKQGERFWCWHFKDENGVYTHDYTNMAPINVRIDTDVSLKLIYMSDNPDDPVLYDTELDKSPNIT